MKKAAIPLVIAGLALGGCGSSSNSTSTGSKSSGASTSASASTGGASCPNNPIRFAVEPYDAADALTKAYTSLAADLQQKLGCPVKLIVTDSYVAEIEAMRAGNLEMGEFGPLGYVLAHKIANAQPVAAFGDTNGQPDTYTAGIWVPKSSPITSLKQLAGKTLALSSTTSTSGGLYPISALISAGFKCTPTGCQGINIKFAGGHPATLLALTHGTVDAAEVNSQTQVSAAAKGEFKASDYRQIWKSSPIINDPVTVAGSLPAAFQAKVKAALLGLTAQQVSVVDTELGTATNGPMVAATDSLYSAVTQVANTVHLSTSDLG
jgi:phosphonate transport system substrate-binding protein